MEEQSRSESYGLTSDHSLGTWTRIYLHGLLAFLVLGAVAYVATRLVPVFDFLDNRPLAITLSVISILAGPPVVGSLVLYLILPWLEKKGAWRGLQSWDDRLLSELSSRKEKTQIVLTNWPLKEWQLYQLSFGSLSRDRLVDS